MAKMKKMLKGIKNKINKIRLSKLIEQNKAFVTMKLTSASRESEIMADPQVIKVIRESGLFDEKFYLATYFNGTKPPVDDLLVHYLTEGVKKKYNPNEYFDTEYYLGVNDDVKTARLNPLWHFIVYGWKEGRNPSVNFDINYYLQTNKDVRATGGNPLTHYLLWGKTEGRSSIAVSEGDAELWTRVQDHFLVEMKDFDDKLTETIGRIAVHCHIFYHDLVDEFHFHLEQVPFPFDVYVSVTSDEGLKVCRQKLQTIKNIEKLEVVKVPNRGRDIAPMFCEFGSKLKEYDFVAHIQSKKSLYNNGATTGWREYLFSTLFGSQENVKRIFLLFRNHSHLGIFYPQAFHHLPYAAFTWLANRGDGSRLCHQMGIAMPDHYFNFPAGSMFWARTTAIKPLFDLNLKWEDFPEEKGQTDGTVAHAMERLLGVVPTAKGFTTVIAKDTQTPSWSHFRFEQQYFMRSLEVFRNAIMDSKTKVVAFDIFDTLLVRPLLNPDHTKKLVMEQLDEKERLAFERSRVQAEIQARTKHGKDIGIKEIYEEFKLLTGLTAETCERIKLLEENIEYSSVTARNEAIAQFNLALELGKRVILISDMFLSSATIIRMLEKNKVKGWHRFYLSSEEGVRKDSGELYARMLKEEGVKGEEVLMIGDNERSDLQLPIDNFQMRCIHLLRANEIARSLPSYKPFLHSKVISNNLNKEISIALIIRNNLSKIGMLTENDINFFAPVAYNVGFNVIGPVVLAFCQWALERARQEKIDKLYFLAREGKLIKQVYDTWTKKDSNVPKSYYLQVSRRAVTVPLITSMNEVLEIASGDFYSNRIEYFLVERFGITLTTEEWNEIYTKKLWIKGELLRIADKDLKKLTPLLKHLLPKMLEEAKQERKTLERYMDQMELKDNSKKAVVDVGYSGTIQKALNNLLQKPIHGLYFATSEKVAHGLNDDVLTDGCYTSKGKPRFANSRIYTHSFSLEQLLSADDAQIVKYVEAAGGTLEKQFKKLRTEEQSTVKTRSELQKGILAYVEAAVEIKQGIYPKFCPDIEMADLIYTQFINADIKRRNAVLEKMILDDDYAGRGLVS